MNSIMPYALRREIVDALQDEAWIEDDCNHQWLCLGFTDRRTFESMHVALRNNGYRLIHA
jgi:hypothetical protein